MGSKTNTDGFFKYQKEKSRIKTLIVTDFFKAYFPIINRGFKVHKIYYIDLFSGPGRYDDGTPSTPIALLDIINQFRDDDIRSKMSIVFNDRDTDTIEKLRKHVQSHPVIEKLQYEPVLLNKDASAVDITQYTSENVPIFSFIDPWGYIDVTADQVWLLVRNYGSDCVLFFNADRILQDISKESQEVYFSQLFGSQLAEARLLQRSDASQRAKSEGFLKLFSKNLYDTVNQTNKYSLFILPFCVEADDKEKTSHYIVFISKAHKAILEMKKVMLKHSNTDYGGLGFDSKDLFQISLMSRTDDLYVSLFNIMKTFFTRYPKYHQVKFTVELLMEKLDKYSMLMDYQVLPYTVSELKQVIEYLYEHKAVDIILKPNQTIRKPITDKREFTINKILLELP